MQPFLKKDDGAYNQSYLAHMVYLAKLGFNVVPIRVNHKERGEGVLHMNGDGVEFQSFDGEFIKKATWEEMDKL